MALRTRLCVTNTPLCPVTAFIMANLAGVRDGVTILDPYAGFHRSNARDFNVTSMVWDMARACSPRGCGGVASDLVVRTGEATASIVTGQMVSAFGRACSVAHMGARACWCGRRVGRGRWAWAWAWAQRFWALAWNVWALAWAWAWVWAWAWRVWALAWAWRVWALAWSGRGRGRWA